MYRQLPKVVLALTAVMWACGGCSSSATPTSPSATAPVSQTSRPPTPIQLTGFVLDSGFRPIAGARVEVVDGPQAGISATADASGQFSLTGSFDNVTTFRASADGYRGATQPWSCSVSECLGASGARPWLGFYLAPLAPPVNIAGDYTLTFVADAACLDLPIELRTRTYAATIAPEDRKHIPANTSFALTVSGASFLGTFDSFTIGVAGDYLGFWLHGGHDPPVVEQLATNAYLAFSGNAAASLPSSSGSPISAAFEGWIDYCELKAPMGAYYNCGTSNWTGEPIPGQAVTYAHCESKNHRLILTRR